MNKKCPWDNTRLFSKRDKSYTRDECYDLCNNTEGCEYFSLGENADDDERGMCMGCTADGVGGEDHRGFTFFEMNASPVASPVASPISPGRDLSADNDIEIADDDAPYW